MKIRSAALFILLFVLLLIGEAFPCGWVLLNPPINKDGFVDRELAARIPLSVWTQEQAFDSASQCESARGRQQKELLAGIDKADVDAKKKSELKVNFLVYTTTQKCVPFDAISDKHPFRGR
jgi:hypothetical protein